MILVTGAAGTVGSELVRMLAPERAVGLTRRELDVTDERSVAAALDTHKPVVVVNAAAYTDVDRAESDRERAHAVNAVAPAVLAEAAAARGAFLVHLSTDFVFDGKLGRPYREDDAPNPICVYAATKLEGERRALEAAHDVAVLRTAWVYGKGHRTFLSQILDLAREGRQLRVVTDQVGSPTWVRDLAAALAMFVERPLRGLFHVAGDGEASRFEFARSIVAAAGLDASQVQPVLTSEMPSRPAARPPYAPLVGPAWQAAGYRPLRPWRDALADAIGDFR